MNNKQTAVEWLENILHDFIHPEHGAEFFPFIDQAKAMEKEQHWRIYLNGWTTRERLDDLVPDIIYPEGLDYEEKQEYAFEKYYNEHYGS